MENIAAFWAQYKTFIFLGLAVLVLLALLRIALNRPSKDELDHEKRMEELKKKHKDRYRDLRPLR